MLIIHLVRGPRTLVPIEIPVRTAVNRGEVSHDYKCDQETCEQCDCTHAGAGIRQGIPNQGPTPEDCPPKSDSDTEQAGDAEDPVNTFFGELFEDYPADINLSGPLPLLFL